MFVVFRVDASQRIGSGHVMRCLTLANAISAFGISSVFVCRAHKGHLASLIEANGNKVLLLPENKKTNRSEAGESVYSQWLGSSYKRDALETLEVLKEVFRDGQPLYCVIDHYGIDFRWECIVQSYFKKLMVLDDLANRKHNCDVLIDQTYGCTKQDYQELVSEKCTLMLGSNYSILRPEFAELRESCLSHRAKKTELKHLLITMGGVDENNLTEDVLRALKNIPFMKKYTITVVLGSEAPWLGKVRLAAEEVSHNSTQVLVNVSNMAELMAQADICIGAAGSTSWERCCLGLPTIMFVVADNQKKIAMGLLEINAVKVIEEISELERNLVSIQKEATEISKIAANVTDGKGVEKITNEMFRLR